MRGGEVYLTGVGLCCSLGATAANCLDAYQSNMPAFRKAIDMVGVDGLPPTLAALIPIAACRDYPERLYRLLSLAVDDLRHSGGDERVPASIHVLLPLWLESHGLRDEIAGLFLDAFGHHAPRTSLIFGGPTRLLTLIDELARHLEPNAIALVAAIDSYIHVDLLDALAAQGRMLSRDNPYGSVPSEAAVLLRVAKRPAAVCGRLVGIREGVESENVLAPKGIIGRGLAAVVHQAGVLGGSAIGRLMVGLTGERWRAEECGFALSAAGSYLSDLTHNLEAPLSIAGDCGTASTALMLALVLAERAVGKNSRQSWILVLDSSRSGERAGCIIEPIREAA